MVQTQITAADSEKININNNNWWQTRMKKSIRGGGKDLAENEKSHIYVQI